MRRFFMDMIRSITGGNKHIKESRILKESNIPVSVQMLSAIEFVTNKNFGDHASIQNENGEVVVSVNQIYFGQKVWTIINDDDFKQYDFIPFKIGMFENDLAIEKHNLRTLAGLPEVIKGSDLHLKDLKIRNLIGCPKKIDHSFTINSCKELENLEGAPEDIGWDFIVKDCSNLKTLAGFPMNRVHGKFHITNCENLESLEELRVREVASSFSIAGCKKISSLKGCPEIVVGSFNCGSTSIKTLEYLPKRIKGNLICDFCDQLLSTKGSGDTLVDGDIYLSGCSRLEDVKEFPIYTGSVYLKGCKLTEKQVRYIISKKTDKYIDHKEFELPSLVKDDEFKDLPF